MSNQTIMEILRRYARQLAREGDNIYRVQAYRRAAETIDRLQEPVVELLRREGRAGLKRLPHIGARLSRTIEKLAGDDV